MISCDRAVGIYPVEHSSTGHRCYLRRDDRAVRVGAAEEEAADHSGHHTRSDPRCRGGRLVDVHHSDGHLCVEQRLELGDAIHGIESEGADGFVAAYIQY